MRQSLVVQCRPGTKDTQKPAIANKILVFTLLITSLQALHCCCDHTQEAVGRDHMARLEVPVLSSRCPVRVVPGLVAEDRVLWPLTEVTSSDNWYLSGTDFK